MFVVGTNIAHVSYEEIWKQADTDYDGELHIKLTMEQDSISLHILLLYPRQTSSSFDGHSNKARPFDVLDRAFKDGPWISFEREVVRHSCGLSRDNIPVKPWQNGGWKAFVRLFLIPPIPWQTNFDNMQPLHLVPNMNDELLEIFVAMPQGQPQSRVETQHVSIQVLHVRNEWKKRG